VVSEKLWCGHHPFGGWDVGVVGRVPCRRRTVRDVVLTALVPLEALQFQGHRDREERAKLHMEITALRQQLFDLGAEPVSRTGEEWLRLYQACSQVIHAASNLTVELGTSAELLKEFR